MMNTLNPLRRALRALAGLLAVAALLSVLSGCGGKGSSADPPTTVNAVAGDGQITVSWNGDPSVDWWVFYAPGNTMTLDNWTSISGSRALQNVASPRVVTGLTNGTQYTVIINGRTDGGKGGTGSAPVFVTPRAAGEGWAPGQTLGTTSVNGIARSTVVYVAVGNGGAVFNSVDGITWTAQNSGTTADLLAVSANGTRVTAVGTGGTIISSVDSGITWAAQSSNTAATLRGLTPYLGGFLAVGDGGYIGLGDGTNWTARNTGTAQPMYTVSVAANVFVTLGAAGVGRFSTDLINWTAINTGVTTDLYTAVVAPGLSNRVVAMGAGGAMITSLDGVNWTVLTPVTTASLNGLVYGSRFVGVGAGGAIVRSDDGLTWTTASSGTTANLQAVSSGAGVFVAGGAGGVTVVSR